MPNKAIAAGGSAGVAGALTTLLTSIFWKNATPDQVGAVLTLATVLCSGLATYYTPHNPAA